MYFWLPVSGFKYLQICACSELDILMLCFIYSRTPFFESSEQCTTHNKNIIGHYKLSTISNNSDATTLPKKGEEEKRKVKKGRGKKKEEEEEGKEKGEGGGKCQT